VPANRLIKTNATPKKGLNDLKSKEVTTTLFYRSTIKKFQEIVYPFYFSDFMVTEMITLNFERIFGDRTNYP
jgi:hypothetical protein